MQALKLETGTTACQTDHMSTRGDVPSVIKGRKVQEQEKKNDHCWYTFHTGTGTQHSQSREEPRPTVNGPEIFSSKVQNAFHLRCGRTLERPRRKGNGFKAKTTIQHSLFCKTGGLVTMHHYELSREPLEWSSQAPTSRNRKSQTIDPF